VSQYGYFVGYSVIIWPLGRAQCHNMATLWGIVSQYGYFVGYSVIIWPLGRAQCQNMATL